MMSKRIFWYSITIICDALVYTDKIYQLKNWCLDNFIRIYFLYYVFTCFLIMLSILAFASYGKSSTFKIKTSPEEMIKIYLKQRKWYVRLMDVISILIDVGFGVIGCWWFFAIGLIKQFLSYLFRQQLKTLVDSLLTTSPELKEKAEDKHDSRLKFKFLKKVV